jgi:L-ascorbate metabolism protein UlaG (beta-lactamase superfamily)
MPMTLLHRAEKSGRKFLNPVPTPVGGWRTIAEGLPRFLANREERVPTRPLGPFPTDAAVYQTPPPTGLRLTWFGHSSTLIEIDGVRLLLDPVWDERASPLQWIGPKRFFAPTLPLENLPELDAVLISHDHYDHLGGRTVRRLADLLRGTKTRWITSLAVGAVLRRFGVPAGRIEELDWTQTTSVPAAPGRSCEITALPARHFSGRSLNRFETLWSSFVLRGTGPDAHSIYFGADSGWWEGFAEIGAAYGPFDLTLLEIGAYDDLWQPIHLGPDGAARAFHDLGGAGLLMPIHWGLFNLALHAWRQPIERLSEIAASTGLKLWSPTPGVPTNLTRNTPLPSHWWREP